MEQAFGASDLDEVISPTQAVPLSRSQSKPWSICSSKLKSKGAVLMIVWIYLVSTAVINLFGETFLPFKAAEGVMAFAVAFLGPFAGLISSIYFGRYRSLLAGIWLIWIGSISVLSVLLLEALFPDSQGVEYNIGLVLAEAVSSLGIILFCVNIIPFGLDQMPDASSEQIKIFVSRMAYSVFAGAATAVIAVDIRDCVDILKSQTSIIQAFVSVLALSMVLCSSFLNRNWFTIEPEDRNPLKRIYQVVKFAVKHKYPVRRSAFTYCEDQQPTRLDLAKAKYGGPFTTEEVENVKTFLRVMVVIAFTVSVVFPVVSLYASASYVLLDFRSLDSSLCHYHLFKSGYIMFFAGLCSPPFYEFVVHRHIKKCFPGILKGIGIAQILTVTVGVMLLTSSVVWYLKHSSSECLFNSEAISTLPVRQYWIEIPVFFCLWSVLLFVCVSLVEFVCAQAPYSQRGLLLGMLYSVMFTTIGLGTLFVFYYHAEAPDGAVCVVWFYATLFVIAVLGCVIWACVVRWYKNRERDEPDRTQMFVEDVYDRYCSLQSR